MAAAPMSRQTDDYYNMDHEERGTAIIFNNKNFSPSSMMPKRKGTNVDAEHLYKLFTKMNFNTVLRKDCTAGDMIATLRKVAAEDHTNADCLAVAVLSHGEEGDKIWGIDKSFSFDDLVEPLKACPSLAGKPKLFFIQACRGTSLDEGQVVCDAIPVYEDELEQMDQSEPLVYKIPNYADFLFAYSTVPGHYAWRNQERGSWFIQSLCEVFSENWERLEIMSMLTRVAKKVAYDFESNCPGPMGENKQISCTTSMLTRDLYFTPKQ